MSGGAVLLMMMMMEEDERRRREEEEEEEEKERRRQEERRRREEERRMIEHRKYSPVICNDEQWQIDRCVKAISMQPFVQKLVSLIKEVKPKVIEIEESKYDEKLLNAGNEYELLKNDVLSDIEELNKLGITLSGNQYEIVRLASSKTSSLKRTTEYYGITFNITNYQPIRIYPDTLSNQKYFKDRYKEMKPQEVEQEINETNF